MSMAANDDVMALSGHCTVEEAEGLLAWLVANPAGRLDLRKVTHLHAAVLQAIAATPNSIAVAPEEPFTRVLLTQLKS